MVTNGFFLRRFPVLSSFLVDSNCRLEVSKHGKRDENVKRFRG